MPDYSGALGAESIERGVRLFGSHGLEQSPRPSADKRRLITTEEIRVIARP